jgi:hypothetical protein
VIALLLALSVAAEEKQFDEQAFADALKKNSYPLQMEGATLRGPGADFLLQEAATSQFVLFGEEHGVREFPEFLSALFAVLHQRDGFNYLAIESDPVSAHASSIRPLRGNFEAVAGYARESPNAFTFPTDQELRMIADAGRLSTGHADAIWGLDQSFGVLHALDRLQELPGFHRTPKFDEIYKQAKELDSARFTSDQTHFISGGVKTSDLEQLRDQSRARAGSEARFILDNLVASSRIYGYYAHAVAGELTGYFNGYVREQQMKQLFMREYRIAQSRGEPLPKVILKLGHWHIFRGMGPSRLQTLGNFVTEFATANNSDAFSVAVYHRGSWRDVSNQKGLSPIAAATDPAAWTVIDFRALRPAVHAVKFGPLNPNLLSHIYGFDAALVIGGASPGTDSSIR